MWLDGERPGARLIDIEYLEMLGPPALDVTDELPVLQSGVVIEFVVQMRQTSSVGVEHETRFQWFEAGNATPKI